MHLWLTEAQAWAVAQHALDAAPQEACGLIGGRDGQALEIIPIANVSATPHVHYVVSPEAFVRAIFQLEKQGLVLIGIYHSHPNGQPIPSQTDIREAYYPDCVYLIVGLQKGVPYLKGWQIETARVRAVDVHVGINPPSYIIDESLTQAQKAAIIVSALVAVAIVLVVALTLLPPAPPIPVP